MVVQQRWQRRLMEKSCILLIVTVGISYKCLLLFANILYLENFLSEYVHSSHYSNDCSKVHSCLTSPNLDSPSMEDNSLRVHDHSPVVLSLGPVPMRCFGSIYLRMSLLWTSLPCLPGGKLGGKGSARAIQQAQTENELLIMIVMLIYNNI